MFWRVVLAVSLGCISSFPSSAQAQPSATPVAPDEPEPEPAVAKPIVVAPIVAPAPADETDEEDAIEAQPDFGDSQEIGGVLGVAMGGGLSPGGLAVEGRYLYRLSDLDWIESSAQFTLGAGGRECFRDRQSDFICEHGLVDGFGAQVTLGIRRYLVGQKQYRPYVRAGAGLGLASFADDEVTGLLLPAYIGAGLRVAVANRVVVVGDANARVGLGLFNQSLGAGAFASLTIAAGVEFTLE